MIDKFYIFDIILLVISMVYLKSFKLLNSEEEMYMLSGETRTYIKNNYPFLIFPNKKLENISFSDITIFYGNNGSGKSTLLNIMANKIDANRNLGLVKGENFVNYMKLCKYDMNNSSCFETKMINSEDIFDYLINVKCINSNLVNQRNNLVNEFVDNKYYKKAKDVTDIEEMKKVINARKKTMSKYVRENILAKDIVEQSNGETALMYFTKEITENGIFILDEPENSLSPIMQIKLAKFLEDSVRFFNCQFIIATHSPFILGIKDALIYDLDSLPVKKKKWSELDNVKEFYKFFKDREEEFK